MNDLATRPILDEEGRRRLQPILNIFGIVFTVLILTWILVITIKSLTGVDLSQYIIPVMIGEVIVTIYFMRNKVLDLINEYLSGNNNTELRKDNRSMGGKGGLVAIISGNDIKLDQNSKIHARGGDGDIPGEGGQVILKSIKGRIKDAGEIDASSGKKTG